MKRVPTTLALAALLGLPPAAPAALREDPASDGRDLHATAVLSTHRCVLGDPVDLTLTVAGEIETRNLTPPALSNHEALTQLFKVYAEPPEPAAEDGKRQFRYTLRPLRTGTLEVPSIAVAFYDTARRAYREVRTDPMPLRVDFPAAGAGTAPSTLARPVAPLAVAPDRVVAAMSPEAAFLWREAQARMIGAVLPAAYLEAAASYRALIRGGARSADVYYNLGTGLLQGGKIDAAMAALRRAERYGGARPDVRWNLELAQAARPDGGQGGRWPRQLFGWHYRFGMKTRAAVAAAAALLCLASWLGRRLRARRCAAALAIVALLFFLAFGISTAVSVAAEARDRAIEMEAAP